MTEWVTRVFEVVPFGEIGDIDEFHIQFQKKIHTYDNKEKFLSHIKTLEKEHVNDSPAYHIINRISECYFFYVKYTDDGETCYRDFAQKYLDQLTTLMIQEINYNTFRLGAGRPYSLKELYSLHLL